MNCVVTKTRNLPPEGLVINNNLGTLYNWSTGTSSGTISFKTDGRIVLTDLASTTKAWIYPIVTSIGSSYYLTLSADGGSIAGTSGISLDTPYLLNSNRDFTIVRASEGITSGTIRYTIRSVVSGSPGPVVSSGYISVYLQVVTGA